jgi:hypothetical protein
MIDEKYVSIPFERWENHYKVLEETLRGKEEEIWKLRQDGIQEFIDRVKDWQVAGWVDIRSYAKGISPLNSSYDQIVVVHIPEIFEIKVGEEVKKRIGKVPYWIRRLFGAK